MSREIKFRAWDNAKKEWTLNIMEFVSSRTGNIWMEPALKSHKVVLEQYTGLKDKNGKEIYEGDIIESTWNGDKAEVVWNDVEGEWEHYADFNTHSKYSGSVVIGNIHENPELLGGEE